MSNFVENVNSAKALPNNLSNGLLVSSGMSFLMAVVIIVVILLYIPHMQHSLSQDESGLYKLINIPILLLQASISIGIITLSYLIFKSCKIYNSNTNPQLITLSFLLFLIFIELIQTKYKIAAILPALIFLLNLLNLFMLNKAKQASY
jgi:hypothetical protein